MTGTIGDARKRESDARAAHNATQHTAAPSLVGELAALVEHWSGCWCTEGSHGEQVQQRDCPSHGSGDCVHMAEGFVAHLTTLLARFPEQPSDPSSEPAPAAYVDVVFDGPPSHESGRFIECENPEGASVRFGEWVQRPGDPEGWWAPRVPTVPAAEVGEGRTTVEWGIERSLPQVNDGKPYIEWNGWTGHDGYSVTYTEKSVWGLSSGRPVWCRTRMSWPDRLSEPYLAATPSPSDSAGEQA